jgi:hypothetical protein
MRPTPNRAFVCLLLPLIVLALPGQAQDAAARSHHWSFTQKKGDIQKYRTFLRITGRNQDGTGDILLTIKSLSRHEVREVAEDGSTTYDQIDERAETNFNGTNTQDKPEDRKPVTVTQARNGIITARTNPKTHPNNVREEKSVMAIQSLPAPEQPVKVGETWKSVFPNPMLKGKTITATSTLVGVEKLFDREALKIKLTAEAPTVPDAIGSEIIKIDATYYLDAQTYQLLRVIYVLKDPWLPLPGGNFEARVLVSRHVPGVNDNGDADAPAILGVKP